MKVLGKRLKEAREKAGLKQIEACKRVGISNGTLSGYERDYRDPDTETLHKLAELYEVSVDWLIGKNNNEGKLTEKDEQDIAKRMEKMRKDLLEGKGSGDGLSYHGEPMSEEAIESLLEFLEMAERQATRINKKYTPKKYREE